MNGNEQDKNEQRKGRKRRGEGKKDWMRKEDEEIRESKERS